MKNFNILQTITRTATAVQRWLRPSDQLKPQSTLSNQEISPGPITVSLIGILPMDASSDDYKKHIDAKYN